MYTLRRMPLLAALLLWPIALLAGVRVGKEAFRLLAALFLLSLLSLNAQPPAGPSGHWEGTIQAPNQDVAIEIDLTLDAPGELSGTAGIPQQQLKGLSLSDAKGTELTGTLTESSRTVPLTFRRAASGNQ